MAASDKPDLDDEKTPDQQPDDEVDQAEVDQAEADQVEGGEAEGEPEEPEPLTLEVKIDEKSACERHITVSVSPEDIERYFDTQYGKLMPKAEVPGFRKGHAPRKLVQTRFRKEVAEQVKSELLVDSIAQINEEEGLSAISEPDLDLDSIDLPDEGPMTFEFDLEVRPKFDMPKWKGLSLERPVYEVTSADIDAAMENLLARYGRLVPHEGAAAEGDYVTCNITFRREGTVLSQASEELVRIRPVLSLRDGNIEKFDELMGGVEGGQTREATVRLTDDAPNEALRGQEVAAEFEVLEVKRLELPELSAKFLEEIGGFESEGDLRDAIADNLKRRLEYRQRQLARQQITALLTEAATWDLPPDLLRRQSHRELERLVMELRSSGFNDDQIRAHENELRQNSRAATARALKEHFILERIAEDEEMEVSEEDYEAQIALMAAQADENPRRVRARLEKENRMDILRNQIIEAKVVNLILQHAEFKDVPYQPEAGQAEAVELSAGGGESEIPEAKPEHAE